jgi:hypothetical protein
MEKREREGEKERTESATLLARRTVARQKGKREREQKMLHYSNAPRRK